MGKQWKQWQTFSWSPKLLHMVTAAMNLKDTCSLKEKLWPRCILKSRDITLLTKFHLVKVMFFPVVMFGHERWIIKKAEHWRIDAFEVWCWWWVHFDPDTATLVFSTGFLFNLALKASFEVVFAQLRDPASSNAWSLVVFFLLPHNNVGLWTCLFPFVSQFLPPYQSTGNFSFFFTNPMGKKEAAT